MFDNIITTTKKRKIDEISKDLDRGIKWMLFWYNS